MSFEQLMQALEAACEPLPDGTVPSVVMQKDYVILQARSETRHKFVPIKRTVNGDPAFMDEYLRHARAALGKAWSG